MKNDFDHSVEGLNREIQKLQKLAEGMELLEKVWIEIGPYGQGKVSDQTASKLSSYFQFDDSE